MARTSRWRIFDEDHGGARIELSDWKYFSELIRNFLNVFDRTTTVWRGHAAAKWKLESTLERGARIAKVKLTPEVSAKHLARFKLAARGRRGISPVSLASDDEWWALGQHFGLSTPLLDWTASPFVALYFAFLSNENDGDGHRAVWGLNRRNVESAARIARKVNPDAPIVEFIEPLSDENARLVNQGGLFTKAPDDRGIIEWIHEHFAADEQVGSFVKIVIPNRGREDCLRMLARMNITHLSLFPDLYGASKHCNAQLLDP